MKWRYPLNAGQVSGKQTLTQARPVTRIHNAVNELQATVVAGVKVDIAGVSVTHAYIRDNVLVLRGAVKGGGGGTGGGGSGGDFEARIAALESKLSGLSLANNFRLAGRNMLLDSTLTLGDGTTIQAVQQSISGVTCANFSEAQ